MKKILTTPITNEDLKDIKIGDTIYLNGTIVTCRDVPHRRLVEGGMELPYDLAGKAIYHAGPIVADNGDGTYKMVSVGATTSMRMEKFEKEFVEKTGVKLLVGKGGMGPNTEAACKEHGALHVVYPAGNACLAATQVKEITEVHWLELGMPEALWVCEVEEFGPLVVSIDTEGNNLFENNKVVFNQRKDEQFEQLKEHLKFIK